VCIDERNKTRLILVQINLVNGSESLKMEYTRFIVGKNLSESHFCPQKLAQIFENCLKSDWKRYEKVNLAPFIGSIVIFYEPC
jgi:hypothetical protein